MNDLKRDHAVVVTLEDGGVDGGFGEKIARFYGDSDVKVLVRGVAKQFADRYDYDDFMRQNGLTAEQLAAVVAALR